MALGRGYRGASFAELTFENYDGQPLFSRMSKRKRYIPDAEAIGDLGRDPVELERRSPGRQVGNLEVLPANPAFPACTDGLHTGLFSGKTRGIALVRVRFSLDVGNFGGGINTVGKTPAVALDGGANAGDLHQVDSDADDHNSAPVDVMVRRPCLTPFVLIKASAIFLTALTRPLTTSTSRQLS